MSAYDLIVIGFGVVMVVALTLLFTRTSLGLAMRATAFNPEVARLSGIRVSRTLTIGWALAGIVGAVGGVLVAPTSAISPNSFDILLVFAFTAAVIGGLDSLIGAVALGIGTGLILSVVSGLQRLQQRTGRRARPARAEPGAQAGGHLRPQLGAIGLGGRMRDLMRLPGARLVTHAAVVIVVWFVMLWVNNNVDPLMNYYIALVAMYATAMFGMVILVGLSGQVSLGNGALMAIGGYVFALTTLNWQTVPILGVPMNGLWAMGFAAVGGVVFGLLIGVLGARLRGPYLAGLTLGIAVGLPAIANRFPELLGGETGLQLTVPYPDGGYAPVDEALEEQFVEELPTEQEALPSEQASPGAEDLLTLDNFPSEGATAEASVAPEDLLTVENFPSGEATVAPDDLLTVDNFPSAEASALPDVPVDGGVDGGSLDSLDVGFIIERWQATLAVAVACIVGFVALNLVRGRQGRVWRAVRDDPVAAAVSGISPAKSKVYAFTVSSLFAALSGAVFAQILAYVGPGAFGLGLSLSLLVGIVLGGRSSLLGALIGAVLLVWLPEFVLSLSNDRGWEEQVTNNAPNLIYGLLVVLVVLVAPGGIVGTVQALVGKAYRKVARNG